VISSATKISKNDIISIDNIIVNPNDFWLDQNKFELKDINTISYSDDVYHLLKTAQPKVKRGFSCAIL
jgi:hypothetical protein